MELSGAVGDFSGALWTIPPWILVHLQRHKTRMMQCPNRLGQKLVVVGKTRQVKICLSSWKIGNLVKGGLELPHRPGYAVPGNASGLAVGLLLPQLCFFQVTSLFPEPVGLREQLEHFVPSSE